MRKTRLGVAVLAAVSILTLGSAFTASAAEWKEVNSEWVYVENNGEYATNTWKLSGDKYYYLGNDGYMVRNTLLNDGEKYYYVNSSGAMVTNEWRFLENPSWQGGDRPDDYSWYYFTGTGKAYATTADRVEIAEIGGKKYAFDSYGRMMTGWITEAGDYVEESEWSNGMYYADGDGDGSVVTNAWVYMTVRDDDNEDDQEPTYHFYFGSNGKKTVSTDKTIGDRKYYFDDRGVSAYDWHQDDNSNWKYYGSSEDPYLHTGWFQAVPDEAMDSDGYSDGTENWYYADSKGVITTGAFKSVGGSTYGFDSTGALLTGLKVITLGDDSKTITHVDDVDSLEDLPSSSDTSRGVFYFADGNGAIKTGTQTIKLDGTNYTFSFKSNGSPKGAGLTGINGGYLYEHGRRLTADEDTKYQVVSYTVDGKENDYVLNESGALQKNKKNLKDADGYYYCTNSDGTLLHGPFSEKCDGKTGH